MRTWCRPKFSVPSRWLLTSPAVPTCLCSWGVSRARGCWDAAVRETDGPSGSRLDTRDGPFVEERVEVEEAEAGSEWRQWRNAS